MKPFVAMALPLVMLVVACAPQPEKMGRALYSDHCVACHGATGRGDGSLAADLDTPPPDLTGIAARNGGTFPDQAVSSASAPHMSTAVAPISVLRRGSLTAAPPKVG